MPMLFKMNYPRLNSLFFDDYIPSHAWCQEVLKNTNKPFHSQKVPVYQWEEILYVAIPWDVDLKNIDLEVEGHWQIVQADPAILRDFWAKYFESNSTQTNKEACEEIKIEINSPLTTPPTALPSAPALTQAPNLDLPEGLDFNFQNTQDLPEGLLEDNLGPTPHDLLKFDLPTLPTTNDKPNQDPVKLPCNPENKTFPQLPENQHHTIQENLDRTIIAETIPNLAPKADLPQPPAPPDVPPQSVGSNATVDTHNPAKEKEGLPAPYIKKLLFRLEGDSLKLLDSNGRLTKVSVDLSAPSPFRIVYRTRNDYHGYVVPCPTLEKFFVEGLNSKVPPFITILPIKENNKVEGMVLAWANEDIQSLEFLNLLKAALFKKGKFKSVA
jgi:hypothetical protein